MGERPDIDMIELAVSGGCVRPAPKRSPRRTRIQVLLAVLSLRARTRRDAVFPLAPREHERVTVSVDGQVVEARRNVNRVDDFEENVNS